MLAADAATIYLVDEGGRLSVGASSPGDGAVGEEFGIWVAESREAMLAQADALVGVPLIAEDEVTGVLVAGAEPPREFGAEDLTLPPARGGAGRARDRACACVRARAPDRGDAPAQPPARPPPRSARARGGRALPARGVGGRGGRRLVRRDPDRRRRVGLVMGDVAGKGLAGASMVGRLRSALRAYALEGHDGGRVVERLNRLLGRRPRRARWRRCSTWSSTPRPARSAG